MGLGFLGSFGHCAGMCGPLTIALSLSRPGERVPVVFHLALNGGRILSYVFVGAAIGALGSVLVAGGQVAGIGSPLRQGMTIFTGTLLIWLGLCHVCPGLLPKIPLLHPLARGPLHERLTHSMQWVSQYRTWWMPGLLGGVWGLMPCGFLYTAQLKAAETSNLWEGAMTMLAFGLGTAPMMIGVGISSGFMTPTRRQQLFRLGGGLTVLMGLLLLTRTGQMTVDVTGYAGLLFLILALVARPLNRFWKEPLRYRRLLGIGAFVFSVIHVFHMLEHTWGWQLQAVAFMLPRHQWGILFGLLSLLLMLPAAATSFDTAQRRLGRRWRSLHLLCVPGLVLAALHCIFTGAHFLGRINAQPIHWIFSIGLGLLVGAVLLVRQSSFWGFLGLQHWYTTAFIASKEISQGQCGLQTDAEKLL